MEPSSPDESETGRANLQQWKLIQDTLSRYRALIGHASASTHDEPEEEKSQASSSTAFSSVHHRYPSTAVAAAVAAPVSAASPTGGETGDATGTGSFPASSAAATTTLEEELDSKQPALPSPLLNQQRQPESAPNAPQQPEEEPPNVAQNQDSEPRNAALLDRVMQSLHAMPATEIAAYRYVSQHNPPLVWQETLVSQYLSMEPNDAWTVAAKMARYWNLKQDVTSCAGNDPEKLALPLRQALNVSENPSLSNGTLVLLPKADPLGQDMLLVQDSDHVDSSSWRAGLFWALYQLSIRRGASLQHGLSVLVRVTRSHSSSPRNHLAIGYQRFVETILEFVDRAFPLWIQKIHIWVQDRNGDNGNNSTEEERRQYNQWIQVFDIQKRGTVAGRICFHAATRENTTLRDRLQVLCEAGYNQEALTKVLSGDGDNPEEIWKAWCGETYNSTGVAAAAAAATLGALPPPPQYALLGPESEAVSEPSISTRGSRLDDMSVTSLEEGSIKALEEAIMLLPHEEKAAYCEAKKVAPHVVQKDSNPLWYLKFEKFNTWDAAKRLAFYWRARCEAFQERAFLPMNQTGEGALFKKDVALFITGYHAFLPPDKDGRTVIFVDASRRSKFRKDVDAAMRVTFYFNHVLMQNEVTVEKGTVTIILVSRSSRDLVARHAFKRMDMGNKAFPCGVHALHIIPKLQKSRSLFDEAVPFYFRCFPRTKANQHVYSCKDKNETLQELMKHGLSREGLPECVGGIWSYDRFPIWQELQLRMEWGLPLGQLDYAHYDHVKYEAKPFSELTPEEKTERKRCFNVLHSRRKRQRDREEAENLERQAEELREEQDEIMQENERLNKLLSRAKRLASRL
mmetsp:Transcript_10100/g.20854  ORF Transcript_10100/g.20854 Transcript_10100/m.20854 type:complete len:855 (-) Transcript_10100:41-2605(-)|eukprot:CAMPEP_0172448074 /NCGR_PEP_ID=MMETSP1065-20121228/7162_1 /TAXON_ID=265537 /ORGANISM="Amphiprora paludosa, Strain CCMP125" /LENGTH=854 /DNA_ID=CAMNT_0013199461 /DNA_START=55 /DNA_END=2619 /DNA_ORIENTATION=+